MILTVTFRIDAKSKVVSIFDVEARVESIFDANIANTRVGSRLIPVGNNLHSFRSFNLILRFGDIVKRGIM